MKCLCKHFSGGIEVGWREEKVEESSCPQSHRVQLHVKLQRTSLQRQAHKAGSAPTNSRSTWGKVSSYHQLCPPRKSGVRTKLGVTTASADNRTGMRSHPASPSANYTGATDCGFQLGAHLLIAKGRGDSRTDLTDMSVQQRDAPSLIVQSEEQRAVCVLMNISCRVLKFRCSVMYLSLTSLFSNIFIPVSPSWILLKHLIYSY